MLVSQHVTTASEIRMRYYGQVSPALPRNFFTIPLVLNHSCEYSQERDAISLATYNFRILEFTWKFLFFWHPDLVIAVFLILVSMYGKNMVRILRRKNE